MGLFFQHWGLFREAITMYPPRLLGLGAAQETQRSWMALGVGADCLGPSPCTLRRLSYPLQWWGVGLMPLSWVLPRDLSFTMEFWVSLKCSVLILPSLSSATTSSLSSSFPLDFLCQTASSLCSPQPTCALTSPRLQHDLNLHRLFTFLALIDLNCGFLGGLVVFLG